MILSDKKKTCFCTTQRSDLCDYTSKSSCCVCSYWIRHPLKLTRSTAMKTGEKESERKNTVAVAGRPVGVLFICGTHLWMSVHTAGIASRCPTAATMYKRWRILTEPVWRTAYIPLNSSMALSYVIPSRRGAPGLFSHVLVTSSADVGQTEFFVVRLAAARWKKIDVIAPVA